jgi:[ribosomal protein S5]-alanine N-acetyltransferase
MAYATGQRVVLRALTAADAVGPWHSWFNDEEITRYLNQWRPNSVERQEEFFHNRVEKSGDLILAVDEKESGRHIGVVSISKIDWVNRFGDIALVIGDKQAQKEATLGFEAFTLMVRVGFLRLNLENLRGGYIAGQEHSEKILRALRFHEVGRFKDLFYIEGVPHDQVLVQLSRKEWLVRNAKDLG